MSKKCNRSAGCGLDDMNEMPTICSTSSVSSRDCEEIKHEGGGFSAELAKNVRSTALKFVRLLRNRASKALHSVSGRRRLPPTMVPSECDAAGSRCTPGLSPVRGRRRLHQIPPLLVKEIMLETLHASTTP
ncbi:hypothetical protein MUK42_32855 [Musa troglodytarum]|uniref:Uncharacterized protein n=1 Tax=Musa troglodytarum TaxID=320322 RepID=A0A9E7LAL1_9LILI|nr:hypothetical protein MUK42_32855 [Musa troglodytarum]